MLEIQITGECNARCEMCKMWFNRENEYVLSTATKLSVIESFASRFPGGMVYFTGGEPLLKVEELYSLSSYCRQNKIPSFASTNGGLFDSENTAKLPTFGPRVLQVSIDSHRSEIHDRIRGVVGLFDTASHGIKNLVRNKKGNDDFSVTINHIVTKSNISDLEIFMEFALDLGVDLVKFQILHQTINQNNKEDRNYNANAIGPDDGFDERLVKLLTKYPEKIANSMDEVFWFQKHVQNPSSNLGGGCLGSLIVNSWGDVMLCHYMKETCGYDLGKIQKGSFENCIASEIAVKGVEFLTKCAKPCGNFLGRPQPFFDWILNIYKANRRNVSGS